MINGAATEVPRNSGPCRVEARRLQGRPDLGDRRRDVAVLQSADGRGAGGGVDEPEQCAQCRGLAGTVGPEEAGDRTRFDSEAEPVYGTHLPAEDLGEVVDHDASVASAHVGESVGNEFSAATPEHSAGRVILPMGGRILPPVHREAFSDRSS